MNYETYVSEYVQFCGKSSACLLCPCTVSCQGIMRPDSPQLKSHFTKLHAPREGFAYCGDCCKAICPVSQPDQIQIHKESQVHIAKASRRGQSFRLCKDCCTVSPAQGHNANHAVLTMDYISLEVAEGPGEKTIPEVGVNAAHCADIFMGIITGKESKFIVGRALCNEHFEKMFKAGWGRTALPMDKGKKAKCYCCKKLNGIWQEIPVREGRQVLVEEKDLRKFVVGYFAAGVTQQMKLAQTVTLIEYAQLGAVEQDFYDFDPIGKHFVRKAAAKNMLTERFMRDGAVEGLVVHDEDDEAEKEEEIDDGSLD